MGARTSVACSSLCTLTALAWLVSMRLAWPDPALVFLHPKGAFVRAGSQFPVQLRRTDLDPDDRELQVGVYCGDAKVAGFTVQIDEFTSHTMPAERPRWVDPREVCTFHLAAAVVAVKQGKTVIRARAAMQIDAQ